LKPENRLQVRVMARITQFRRVVITGLGTINPLGHSTPKTWERLCQRKSGIGPISHFDASTYPVRIAGEVGNLDTSLLGKMKRTDRFVQMGVLAAIEAMADSGLNPAALSDRERQRFGVLAGTGIAGVTTIYGEAGRYLAYQGEG